ncbi:hypothetical protein JW887_00825 [Candidatus Dojkabacteria bacterium]|nr:hypothetical protein [Candidatus Dojkabacteria bacterium]
MRIENLLIIVTGCLSVIVPIFLFSRNRKSSSYLILVILAIITGPLWAISIALFREATDTVRALFWNRMIYVIAILIGFSFFYFIKAFPKKKEIGVLPTLLVHIVGLILLVILLFTDYFIEKIILNDAGNSVQLGGGYVLWLIWMLSIFGIGIISIINEFSKLGDVERNQLRYFVIAIIIPSIGVVPTNAVLPLFGEYRYIWIGPLLMIPMNLIIAYGISRTRFIGAGVVQKTVVRFLALVINVSFIHFLLSFLKSFIQEHTSLAHLDIIFVFGEITFIVLGIMLSYGWINRVLVRAVVRRYYNEVEVRDQFIRSTSSELDLDKISTVVFSTLYTSMNISRAGLVMLDNRNDEVVYQRFKNIVDLSLGDLKEMYYFWEASSFKDEPLLLNELEYVLGNQIGQLSSKESERIQKAIKFLNDNRISGIFSFTHRDSLTGFLLIGMENKLYFHSEDVDLLELLVNNVGVAISRALLYQEVRNFNETLQAKVDEQTHTLRDKVDELEKAQQRERDMLDILGHELRTPLSIIRNAFGLIEMKGKDNKLSTKDLQTYIEKGKEATEREIEIVENMLRATKLSSGQVMLNYESVGMVDVIEESIESQREKAQEKGIKMFFNKSKDKKVTFNVYADRTATQEVTDNLLDNAIKYTEKGSVTIDIGHNNDFVTVHVKDTGKGIPAEEIDNLGQKFYRVDQYLGDQEERKLKMVRPGGTGIGLYVVYGLIKQMKGKIWVDSKVGEGSTFHFSLPIYKGQKVDDSGKKEANVFKRLGLKE